MSEKELYKKQRKQCQKCAEELVYVVNKHKDQLGLMTTIGNALFARPDITLRKSEAVKELSNLADELEATAKKQILYFQKKWTNNLLEETFDTVNTIHNQFFGTLFEKIMLQASWNTAFGIEDNEPLEAGIKPNELMIYKFFSTPSPKGDTTAQLITKTFDFMDETARKIKRGSFLSVDGAATKEWTAESFQRANELLFFKLSGHIEQVLDVTVEANNHYRISRAFGKKNILPSTPQYAAYSLLMMCLSQKQDTIRAFLYAMGIPSLQFRFKGENEANQYIKEAEQYVKDWDERFMREAASLMECVRFGVEEKDFNRMVGVAFEPEEIKEVFDRYDKEERQLDNMDKIRNIICTLNEKAIS